MKNTAIIISIASIILIQSCKNTVVQWRGVDRNGIYYEDGLLDEWPENGPEVLWVYEGLGRGYAAPIVSNGKVFVNGEEDSISHLYAIDMNGELLWKSPNGEEYLGEGFSSTYPGARSAPTVIGNLVYASSGEGRLACFNSVNGEEKWAVHLEDDLHGMIAYFGYSESVAVDKKNVYCFAGGAENNFVALDRLSGEVRWTSEVLKDTFAYGSPSLVDLPEREILISTSKYNMFVLDRSTGELLSSYELEEIAYDGEHCNSPVYIDGYIYYVANDRGGQGALKLELSEDGEDIKEVWRNPEILNNFGGFVVVNDHLFTMLKGNRLVSIETEGGTVTDSIRVASGSIIFSDNKFITYGYNGIVNLISYREGEMKTISEFRVKEGSGHHFSHPVLADGLMYIRHGDALVAYKVGDV
ncbi:PQQ-binding-like beta-propeller repeat protein [Bacteroidota bacterium]